MRQPGPLIPRAVLLMRLRHISHAHPPAMYPLHHRKAVQALPAASWGLLAGLSPLYIASFANLYINRISGWYQYCRANIKTSYACRSLNATPRKIFLFSSAVGIFSLGRGFAPRMTILYKLIRDGLKLSVYYCLIERLVRLSGLPFFRSALPYSALIAPYRLFRHPK